MTEVNNGRPYKRNGKPLSRKVVKRKTSSSIHIYNERDHDFLKYIRVVFKWATAHSGLTRSDLEVLLYFYSKGIFTKAEFREYHNTISALTSARWERWFRLGLLREWRTQRTNKAKGLYDLTSKAKIICSKMHQMCLGEMDVPTSRRSNPLNKNKEVKVNKLYTKLFHKMNNERKDRLENKERDVE